MPTVPTSTLKIAQDCFLHWFVAYLLTGDMLTLSYTGYEMWMIRRKEGEAGIIWMLPLADFENERP